MDPCPFARVVIGNLALKFPVASKPTFSGVHPSSSPCFCTIKLNCFQTQVATVPLYSHDQLHPDPHLQPTSACFNLSQSDIEKLSKSKRPRLKISLYTGRPGTSCGLSSRRLLLGSVSVELDLKGVEARAGMFHNGWVSIGGSAKKSNSSSAQLFLNVRAEPDPRFVFEFDGEPECSPQVFQIQGNIRQPVFTCKFSFRNSGDRNLRSRSSLCEPSTSRTWLSSLVSEKERSSKVRKGWSITIHDLSGSPVAAASMVTPFVPSPGTNRVSRANPGAWLILRPGADGTWQPWGRVEAWRASADSVGYRFKFLPDGGAATGITMSESTLSTKHGGKFTIDNASTASSPLTSPSSSFDLGSWSGSSSWSGSWLSCMYRGFVMSATVDGTRRSSRPAVEVGVEHVTCTEDAAVFVALAAALDLSMDACRLFTQKLRKELRQPRGESVV